MIPAFPKPSQIKKPVAPIRVMKDGREIINHNTKEGRDEYQRRKRVAWEEQGRLCAICHKPLKWKDCTADHIIPRGIGGGSRDDRQKNIAAAHILCNTQRGSQRKGFYGIPLDLSDIP